MGFNSNCRSLCERLPVNLTTKRWRHIDGTPMYALGWGYCGTCRRLFNCPVLNNGQRCPCCNSRLSIRPHSGNQKKAPYWIEHRQRHAF